MSSRVSQESGPGEVKRRAQRRVQPVRTVLRALTLTQLDQGKPVSEVAANVSLTPKSVREIGRRYEDAGLEKALYDKPWPCSRTANGSGSLP